MIKSFSDWNLNEAKDEFGKLSFREVSALLRKQFPDLEMKMTSKTKCYYSPKIEEMKIFRLGEYYSGWIYATCREVYIPNGKGENAIEVAKFLQKNKISAWANCDDSQT